LTADSQSLSYSDRNLLFHSIYGFSEAFFFYLFFYHLPGC